jgi:hypothetical protein
MVFRTTILLLALVVGVMPQPGERRPVLRPVLGACATFAPDGTSIGVSIDADNVSLEIAQPSGAASHLSMALSQLISTTPLEHGATYLCNAYVDLNGGLVAVGISRRFSNSGQLQVAVANLKSLTWIGEWTVARESGFYSPSLAGFLEGTNSLAVAGEPSARDHRGIQHGSFATLLFDPTGKQLMPVPTTRIYAHETELFPTYADARHNRLWFVRSDPIPKPDSRQPLSPVGSVTLVGDEPKSSEFTPSIQGKKRSDLWFLPGTFASPDFNTILVAAGDTVWRVDMHAQTVDHLALPKRAHFPRFDEIHGTAAISPDGQVIAVPMTRHAVAFPYLMDNYVYKGTDIAVVRVSPLQLLAILPQEGAPGLVAFAVDHRQGTVTVLFYRQDHWERHELDATLRP